MAPALVLLGGFGLVTLLQPARSLPLRKPLTGVADQLGDFRSIGDRPIEKWEDKILEGDAYLRRDYRETTGGGAEADVFVAYYGSQTGGASIHSPRNCLPGAGWEPVAHTTIPVHTELGSGHVNRYVVQHGSGRRAVVYYWYEGRGRIAASEYLVKWQMLRDAVWRRRTDEALVRIVFPGDSVAAATARGLVVRLSNDLAGRLPE